MTENHSKPETDLLLPCPFCGAAPSYAFEENTWNLVRCTNRKCGVQSGIFPTKPMAFRSWNARVIPAQQQPDGLANLRAIMADQPYLNSALSIFEIDVLLKNEGGFMPDEAVAWFRGARGKLGTGLKYDKERRTIVRDPAFAVPPHDSADLHDFVTHRDSWRSALERARDVAGTDGNDDDALYWEHEIKAFNSAFDTLAGILPFSPGLSQEATTEINEETLADFIGNAEERLGPGCDEQAIAQAILADFDVRAKR